MRKKADLILAAGALAALLACVITVGASRPDVSIINDPERLSCCEVSEIDGATSSATKPPEQETKSDAEPDKSSDSKAAAVEAAPAGLIVRGSVKISDKWDLQKPDFTRVVVYIASDPALDAVPSEIDHATVSQKNKTFVPNFTVVPLNTVVEFPNWDDFDHNVFSRSKAAPAFDLDRYPKGQSKSRRFEKVGVVQVFCNIHPQMRCIIFVTPNRYFTRADAGGRFEIKDVPPGKYSIVAWQERCGDQQQPLEVSPAKHDEVSFTLEENRESVIANNPPKHDAGYGVERGLGIKREKLNLPVVKESHPAPPQDAPD